MRLWKWWPGSQQHGLRFTGWGIVRGELVYLTPMAASVMGKKVIHDSLLRETEGSICWPDPNHREICFLPGVQLRGATKKLPSLVQPSDYYPLTSFSAGQWGSPKTPEEYQEGPHCFGITHWGMWSTSSVLCSGSCRGRWEEENHTDE